MGGVCTCSKRGILDDGDSSILVVSRQRSHLLDKGFDCMGSAGGQFKMSVEESEAKPVLKLDICDGASLAIVDIEQSNVELTPGTPASLTLRPHDRIMEANGISNDSAEMMKVLKVAQHWELTVQRPMEFHAEVTHKANVPLGVELRFAPNGISLVVVSVTDGPLQDWNAVSSKHRIEKFDRIVEVNGTRGVSRELLAATKGREVLRLTFLKYSSNPLEVMQPAASRIALVGCADTHPGDPALRTTLH
mmetsp:Transcript_57115/g.165502  ORF Transcript_57115/g.165502 Transcript_57115/m.165502 type:complete len:248 (-) Transcript_57115:263-1006(-)